MIGGEGFPAGGSGDRDVIVSSDSEQLILVDLDDTELGFESKARCHDGDGILHRAFSVFLTDPAGRVLLQQRANDKRLWGGYWANSCCSHPRRGESMELATSRRLAEELGVAVGAGVRLHYVYKFDYHARFGDLGSERELCWVFVGEVDPAAVDYNRTEIAAIRWVTPAELDAELAGHPEHFTPWLHLEWEQLRERWQPGS